MACQNPDVAAFMAASRRADRRRSNRKRYLRALVALGVLSIVFGVLAVGGQRSANRSAELATAAANTSPRSAARGRVLATYGDST